MSNFKRILDSLGRSEAICGAEEFDQLDVLVDASIGAMSDWRRAADGLPYMRTQMLAHIQVRLRELLEELSMATALLEIERLQRGSSRYE
jgi:DNA repair ATPase RecN